jgi:hypothetical protein
MESPDVTVVLSDKMEAVPFERAGRRGPEARADDARVSSKIFVFSMPMMFHGMI